MITGNTVLKAMANKNFQLYAQALKPYLEGFKNQKRGKATKKKSKDSIQDEDSAKTQSSSPVMGPEVSVEPGVVRTSKRKRMSEGDVESEANETPTENRAMGGIAGSARTWMTGKYGMPVWPSISQGPRMPGEHEIPHGNRSTGKDETLERIGAYGSVAFHARRAQHARMREQGLPHGDGFTGQQKMLPRNPMPADYGTHGYQYGTTRR